MSIVDYAERILGLTLWPYQKQFLQKLEKLPPGTHLVSTPKGMMVIRENSSKEDQK